MIVLKNMIRMGLPLLGLSLLTGCSSGIGHFLAPVVQPVIGQVLSTFANAFTTNVLSQ